VVLNRGQGLAETAQVMGQGLVETAQVMSSLVGSQPPQFHLAECVIFHIVVAAIFDDCYHIACEFIKISFNHVPRDANMAAHELAKLARSDDSSVWMDQPP
jgi:predicted secreted protein